MQPATSYRVISRVGSLLALAAISVFLASDDAHGVGMAQVMEAKSLPEATVQVLDPESGTSTGEGGGDIRLAPGDVILFRFSFSPVPDKVNRGMQAYLTEYLPPNTEVVGVRIIDANGHTVKPRLPGLAIEGCSGSNCNNFPSLPCAAGTCSFPRGTAAQVHADTGIFFSTDPRLARVPNDQFITMNNGVLMNPIPNGINPDLLPLLDHSGSVYSHNSWDWHQVLAYGIKNADGNPSGTGSGGITPYRYGSPVAGPETFYIYEATQTGTGPTGIRFNNVVGPWRRIRYPGSKIGFGSANPAGIQATRMVRDPVGSEVGWDVTPANPITGARAVRFALGEGRTGSPMYVEVALRVTDVPIDPFFGTSGENLDCGESFGSGVAVRGNNNDGNNHPWLTYIASPACVYLKLLFDLTSDKDLALGNTQPFHEINYTLHGKNLSLLPETNVVVYQMFDSTRASYVTGSASVPPDAAPGPCPFDTGKSCLRWTLGTLQPSEEYTITTKFTPGGGGKTSAVMEGRYTSDQLPAGFITRDLTVITGIALPDLTLRPQLDPTVSFATPGTTTRLVGTISNAGTNAFTFSTIVLPLPAGWRQGGAIRIGATNYNCTAGCATNTPSYTINASFGINDARAIEIPLAVPTGTATGLYPIDVQIWGGQTGFGGDFETYFPESATIPVGAVRTAPPELSCPINSATPAITGTSEPSATVRALFTLIERGSGEADATGHFAITNFSAFGGLYGGLEVRATAQVAGKLVSELSVPCEVTMRPACSDGIDNDGDGLIDFPADPGCDSPGDNDESNELPECSDGVDNDGDGTIDWPADPSCENAFDPTEDGVPACSDGVDNDGDGLIDYPADPDCTDPDDSTEATLRACQDRIDNDGDGFIDFDGAGNPALADPGCHSAFDDDEGDLGFSPIDVAPRLLIVFDTSGSMNWNTCSSDFTGGDGSIDFPGDDVICDELPASCSGSALDTCDNGQPDDSRLYKVKNGMVDVIAAFGEVEYGLMRFHQRPTEFHAPTTNASLRSGGWQGGGAAPCGGGFSAGDLLVSFARDNQETIIGWMDGSSNYAGTPPPGLDFELRGSGTTALGGSLDSALEYLDAVRLGDDKRTCRPYRVILVTDGQETCGGDPVSAAQNLYLAGIPVAVIGFATGDPEMITNLNAIAHAGSDPSQPLDAFFVDDESALSMAIASIITDSILVEFCNGLDDDCDGLIDEGFAVGQGCDNGQLGVCHQTGVTECAPSGFDVVCTAPPGTPGVEVCNLLDDDCDGRIDEGIICACSPTEICNGVDDDCDGEIDENVPGVGLPCGIDIGACQPGTLVCTGGGLVCEGAIGPADGDACNGIDDDCDGFVDEDINECYTFPSGCEIGVSCQGICRTGFQGCVGGAPGACVGQVGPQTESCNGQDDDCDGQVDEDWPEVGTPCDNGLQGACYATGIWQCRRDGLGAVCTAPVIPPGIEICNGIDDDCDGNIDEDLGAPIGNSCGGTSQCTPGVFECVSDGMGGARIECVGSEGGSPEVCNGIDDDCDGTIDEGIPGVGLPCTPPGYEDYGDTGTCEFGTTVCAPPDGVICAGYVGPSDIELCDGLDNNCDGEVDNEAQCPSEDQVCVAGQCASGCREGEFPCPFGYICETLAEGRFCLMDPCAGVSCPNGWICDSGTGLCRDLCDGVQCNEGLECRNGACFDCRVLGCGEGQLCVPGPGGVSTCQPDPCQDTNCGPGEFCRNGECVPLACQPACADGEICVDGTCRADMCDGVSCRIGQICNPDTGMCVVNQCGIITCGDSQACNPSTGMCITDPCLSTDCPDRYVCEITFHGSSRCRFQDDAEYVYAGGSGCSAAGPGRGAGGGALLLLALVLLAVRPRRRRALA